MKRIKVLIGKRRVMVLVTLAILVLAAAALVASSASFTASSANINNTFATGNLTMTNGTINFDSGKLMPGHGLTGTVDLTATADGGTASLYLKRTALSGSALLAGKLTLTITETTLGTVYATKTLDAADLATANGIKVATVPNGATGTSYHFVFTVNFPDGGIPADASSGDNALKGLSAGSTYVFTAISD